MNMDVSLDKSEWDYMRHDEVETRFLLNQVLHGADDESQWDHGQNMVVMRRCCFEGQPHAGCRVVGASA